MKSRKLYAIRSYSGQTCMMSGWGESIPEAVENFRTNVLIELVDQERNKVAWKDNMSCVIPDSIKRFERRMNHYLDDFTVHYEVFNEEYCEERQEWIASGERQTFRMKYPMRRKF